MARLKSIVLERRYWRAGYADYSTWRQAMSFPPDVSHLMGMSSETPGVTTLTIEYPDGSSVQYRVTVKEQ